MHFGLKPSFFVAAVAKGFVLRMPAAADIDGRAPTQTEHFAFSIAERYFAFDLQWTIANYRDLRHVLLQVSRPRLALTECP